MVAQGEDSLDNLRSQGALFVGAILGCFWVVLIYIFVRVDIFHPSASDPKNWVGEFKVSLSINTKKKESFSFENIENKDSIIVDTVISSLNTKSSAELIAKEAPNTTDGKNISNYSEKDSDQIPEIQHETNPSVTNPSVTNPSVSNPFVKGAVASHDSSENTEVEHSTSGTIFNPVLAEKFLAENKKAAPVKTNREQYLQAGIINYLNTDGSETVQLGDRCFTVRASQFNPRDAHWSLPKKCYGAQTESDRIAEGLERAMKARFR